MKPSHPSSRRSPVLVRVGSVTFVQSGPHTRVDPTVLPAYRAALRMRPTLCLGTNPQPNPCPVVQRVDHFLQYNDAWPRTCHLCLNYCLINASSACPCGKRRALHSVHARSAASPRSHLTPLCEPSAAAATQPLRSWLTDEDQDQPEERPHSDYHSDPLIAHPTPQHPTQLNPILPASLSPWHLPATEVPTATARRHRTT